MNLRLTTRTSVWANTRSLWAANERVWVALELVVILAGWLLSARAVTATSVGTQTSEAKTDAATVSETNKYRTAEKRYESLLKIRPNSARLWSNLGAVRAMLNECPSALEALERARTLNKTLFAPWYYAGYCHLVLRQDRQALASLQQATHLTPQSSDAWFLKAQAYAKLGQPMSSFEAAIRSLGLDSDRPAAYYLAGEDALRVTQQEYARVMAQPNGVYALRLRAERDLGQGVPVAAAADYRKALLLEPGAPDLLFGLGSAELAEGKFEDAEKTFRRCLTLLPDSAWATLRLALALTAQSKGRQATELLSSVQTSELGSPFEWEDLIATAYLLEHPSVAEHWLNQAESRFPDDPAWSLWARRIAREKAMPDEPPRSSFSFERSASVALSVTFMLTTHMISGNFVAKEWSDPAQFQVFRTVFLMGDPIRTGAALEDRPFHPPSQARGAYVSGDVLHLISLRLFQELTSRYPTSVSAMMLAAKNYSAMGDQAKAIEIFRALLKERGPSVDVLRGLAKIYYSQSDWNQARPLLLQLAKLDPNDPTIYVNLGRIYTYQDKWEDAEKSFALAAHLGPRTYEAHLALGEVLDHQGEENQAINELTLAARLRPSNPQPHYLLAVIYRRLGEKERAAKEMQRFEELQAQSSAESSHETQP